MEFSLEGILETLLVGAMVGLLILSSGFFVLGHVWPLPIIRRLLDVLFSESAEPREARSGPGPGAHRSVAAGTVRRARKARKVPRKRGEGEERPISFSVVVLLATLYGLGIIAETASHKYREELDSAVKRASFKQVAHGQLNSGTAPERIAQFISDYDACGNLALADQKKPETAEKAEKPAFSRLCQKMDQRVLEFYHNAKNAVFQSRTYNRELIELESRINFMRAFSLLSIFLYWLLGAVAVVATVAETLHRLFRGVWMRRIHDPWPHKILWLRKPADDLARHWVKIAALRCWLLFGASVGFSLLATAACDTCIKQFDRRVFGYYFALLPAGSAVGPVLSTDDVHPQAKSQALRDVTPPSPYRAFSLKSRPSEEAPSVATSLGPDGKRVVPWDTADLERRRLEPSGVHVLGRTSRFLVANDQGGKTPFWLFTLDGGTAQLVKPTPVHLDEAVMQGAHIAELGKVEAFFVVEHDQDCAAGARGDTFRIYATMSSPEDGGADKARPAPPGEPGVRRQSILSFCLSSGSADPRMEKLQILSVPSPCQVFDKGTSRAKCWVEGLASAERAGQRSLIFGIQAIERAEQGRSTERQPVVAIVAIVAIGPKPTDGWTAPTQIFPSVPIVGEAPKELKDFEENKIPAGVSDLIISPSGRFYVTTSVEVKPIAAGHPDAEKTEKAEGGGPPSIRGALWSIDPGCQAWPRPGCGEHPDVQLIETFVHKPEGVTDLGDGSLLVVFDDEGHRKSHEWTPITFPLGQNESVFAVVQAPEIRLE